jgi:hypothetical protein
LEEKDIAAFSVSAGGVLFQGRTVLLEQVDYGSNRGMWMLPGGFVKRGEFIEEAAIREFEEGTGLITTTGRVVCLRSGTHEFAEVRFWDMDTVARSSEIVELSKMAVTASWETANGLCEGNQVKAKNAYRTYCYYVPNR